MYCIPAAPSGCAYLFAWTGNSSPAPAAPSPPSGLLVRLVPSTCLHHYTPPPLVPATLPSTCTQVGSLHLLGHHLTPDDAYLAYLLVAHTLEYIVGLIMLFWGMPTGFMGLKVGFRLRLGIT
ncbi:hypothetical protein K438DRAFT_1144088 [Mycena galopus ATCC 62051]|nr:hypothetical protein K438DRAFT_1144088 [Mycena galopus ATCC 62051]